MKIVGEKLQSIALCETNFENKDLFGRSAFNRYYYAAYLVTRESLGLLNHKWRGVNHSTIPDLLKGSVYKDAAKSLKHSKKLDLISSSSCSRDLNSLRLATNELSLLLSQAYDARSIADYEPEQRINIDGKKISLSKYKLSSACQWEGVAKMHCKTILRIWRGAGLVQ